MDCVLLVFEYKNKSTSHHKITYVSPSGSKSILLTVDTSLCTMDLVCCPWVYVFAVAWWVGWEWVGWAWVGREWGRCSVHGWLTCIACCWVLWGCCIDPIKLKIQFGLYGIYGPNIWKNAGFGGTRQRWITYLRSGEGCLWVDCWDVVLSKERKFILRTIRRDRHERWCPHPLQKGL